MGETGSDLSPPSVLSNLETHETMAVSSQEKCVTPMDSKMSVMYITVKEPYKLQTRTGHLEAMSCGMSWPKARTLW